MNTALWIVIVVSVMDGWQRMWWLSCDRYPRHLSRSKLDDAAWFGFDALVLLLIAADLVP